MKRPVKIAVLTIVTLVTVFGLTITPTRAADDGLEALKQTSKAFTTVAKKTTPAVVAISVEKTIETGGAYPGRSPFDSDLFERFFGAPRRAPDEKQIQRGQGSGFIVSKDGYILTNNHVVGGADDILVVMDDGRKLDAKLVGTDPKSEVALIKVDADNLPTVELADSDETEVGEWVIAVGNPFGFSATVTAGVVSAKHRYVSIIDEEGSYEDFIQTDAAINPGNSGGPLLNLDGKVVGINTAIYSQSGGNMGIGFAIPINLAKHVKDQLIKTGKVERSYVGIKMTQQNITPAIAKAFKLKSNNGVIIEEVVEGTPADEAGLKADDVIVKLNGRTVKNYMTFRPAVAYLAPGTEVELTIVREGREKVVKLKIASQSDEAFATATFEAIKDLGLSVQNLEPELAKRFGYEAGKGVIVTEVERKSEAYRADIRAGMVILSVDRNEVNNVDEFNKALIDAGKKGEETVMLRVRNEEYAWFVVLTIK